MAGNVTILMGVDEEKVQTVIDIIKEQSHSRKQMIPTTTEMSYGYYPHAGGGRMGHHLVVDIERFERVHNGSHSAGGQRCAEAAAGGRASPAGPLPRVHSQRQRRIGAEDSAASWPPPWLRRGRAEARPCLACSGCRKVLAGIHPDVNYTGTDGRDITVAQVRALRPTPISVPTRRPEGLCGFKRPNHESQRPKRHVQALRRARPSGLPPPYR